MPRAPAASISFRSIWRVVSRIPLGRVATYGQIARMAGLPGAARTVGWAMNALPVGARVGGRAVPWHRVINAAGRISPRASDGGGAEGRQARRLRSEGVRVSRSGRVDLGLFRWDGAQAGASAPGKGLPVGARRAVLARVPNWSSHRRA
jgi:methylated-DNA-protein-cysteine methyltransferase-like protein